MTCLERRSRVPARLALTLLAIAFVTAAVPSTARADGIFSANVGYFALRGTDTRPDDDVLLQNQDFLSFEMDDFNSVTFGGEFHIGLGDFVEAGAGASFYQRTVPSVYTDFVNPNGSEVEQSLKLRVSPVTFTARVFPMGRTGPVQPYAGGGLAILSWRYSEFGDFIDFDAGNMVFHDTFTDRGNQAAPVVFGGLRFPVGDSVLIGGEFRWHGGEATLDPSQNFAGDKLDLSAFSTQATFQFRF